MTRTLWSLGPETPLLKQSHPVTSPGLPVQCRSHPSCAIVVAGLGQQSLALQQRVGFLPILIFGVTWAVGEVLSVLPWKRAVPCNPTGDYPAGPVTENGSTFGS